MSELFDEELLKEKVARVCEIKNVMFEHLYHKPPIDSQELLTTLLSYRDMIAPYVCDVSAYLHEALKEGKNILLEGQLGSLKDPDHGIYPMVTSSSTLAAYGAIGAGIPPYEIKRITTVVKAYSSAVGAGAFVSEIFGEEADELRRRGGDGGEFGATTGRPRRMGWFDAVASRYGCRIQGATEAALTVLDVLGYLDEIPVCVGYEIDGEVTKDFPVPYPGRDRGGAHGAGCAGILRRAARLRRLRDRRRSDKGLPYDGQAGKSKARLHDPAGLEMRYPGNQDLRRTAGKLPQVRGIHRKRAGRAGDHGFQRPRPRRYYHAISQPKKGLCRRQGSFFLLSAPCRLAV